MIEALPPAQLRMITFCCAWATVPKEADRKVSELTQCLLRGRTSLHLIEFMKQRMFAIWPLLLLIRLEIDMHIKSFLFGAAAALATVSSAHAADAIVAAEPEPLEYVRVCDAFGAGFFYIPGSET